MKRRLDQRAQPLPIPNHMHTTEPPTLGARTTQWSGAAHGAFDLGHGLQTP
eukprot:CAMPEP_0196740396 /NCGR_PEP_ID=MMETSP1091-20130531/31512_1 /TAXON_ID=302021 /ORGANISM="Rhodomonas sp., Strain CCMP768" /LENGTH=50 /DNA_ID=CAMNT_0042085525 /DNA_START=97 /DNA_END=245 /DNA_ORIENTATION=+